MISSFGSPSLEFFFSISPPLSPYSGSGYSVAIVPLSRRKDEEGKGDREDKKKRTGRDVVVVQREKREQRSKRDEMRA